MVYTNKYTIQIIYTTFGDLWNQTYFHDYPRNMLVLSVEGISDSRKPKDRSRRIFMEKLMEFITLAEV